MKTKTIRILEDAMTDKDNIPYQYVSIRLLAHKLEGITKDEYTELMDKLIESFNRDKFTVTGGFELQIEENYDK